MEYQITINRWAGIKEVSKENWKDLISSLVLNGYEVYGDEEKIIFTLGVDDTIKEIEDEKSN